MNVAEHIIRHCGGYKKGEKVLILHDDTTQSVAAVFLEYLKSLDAEFSSFKLELTDTHGTEPPGSVSEKMKESDLILCLTHYSLAHTQARKEATDGKSRFLSMPEYSMQLLENPAMKIDYKSMLAAVEAMTKAFTGGKELLIETAKGTQLLLDISGRNGNCCPGFVDQVFHLGSPPDIESNIAPIEVLTEGKLVIDGSITHPRIGKLAEPVEMIISGGKLTSMYSKDIECCDTLDSIFRSVNDEKAYYLAEVGVGFNKEAVLCGNMLVDEGAYGCIHFGFGSNYTIQGCNKVAFHLDFVMSKANMYIDKKMVIREGDILL